MAEGFFISRIILLLDQFYINEFMHAKSSDDYSIIFHNVKYVFMIIKVYDVFSILLKFHAHQLNLYELNFLRQLDLKPF